MTQITPASDEGGLLSELSKRVKALATTTLVPEDAKLAETLVGLLVHFERLHALDRQISPDSSTMPSSVSKQDDHRDWSPIEPPPPGDPLAALRRQVSDLQVERLYAGDSSLPNTTDGAAGATPAMAVEAALLWARIDEQLDTLLTLSRARARSDAGSVSLPPEYEEEGLPGYEFEKGRESVESKGPRESGASWDSAAAPNEKMRADLEAVTSAIDRLYAVCPQLHSQRVELRDTKRRALEKAREAPRSPELEEARELERLMGLIGRMEERKMVNQSVVLDGDSMRRRMERARVRDMEKVCLRPSLGEITC